MPYLYLSFAIVSEVIGTSALKLSDGFTKLYPSLAVVVCFSIAFYCMSLSLKGIPVNIVYAIWSGVGMALITLIGAVMFRQVPDMAAVIGISLIILGVIILRFFSKMTVE